jgi:CBS domain-containing protein
MATVLDILSIKGNRVLSIGPEASALDAALRMNEHKIGGLVVMEEGRVVGIITERDLLQRVMAQRLDPGSAVVRDIMTAEVVCCRPHTTLDEARGVMKNRRIRHLPVVDEAGRIAGLISIGDLNAYHAHDQERTIYFLQEYIHGRV